MSTSPSGQTPRSAEYHKGTGFVEGRLNSWESGRRRSKLKVVAGRPVPGSNPGQGGARREREAGGAQFPSGRGAREAPRPTTCSSQFGGSNGTTEAVKPRTGRRGAGSAGIASEIDYKDVHIPGRLVSAQGKMFAAVARHLLPPAVAASAIKHTRFLTVTHTGRHRRTDRRIHVQDKYLLKGSWSVWGGRRCRGSLRP